jgi:hypothetical protein
MPDIEVLRQQARRLCADRGLLIHPYGKGSWAMASAVNYELGALILVKLGVRTENRTYEQKDT